jgi:hypothetical protein
MGVYRGMGIYSVYRVRVVGKDKKTKRQKDKKRENEIKR